jgi:hypothetical protein
VTHPDGLLALDPFEQAVVLRDRHVGGAVFTARGRQDVAAELLGHQVGPVTDAEDRDPAGPDLRVRAGRTFVVDRVGTARKDDRASMPTFDLGVRGVVRQQL